MGAIIQGKVYPDYKCISCEKTYSTDESTINGLTEEDVNEFGFEVGDHLCINCEMEIYNDRWETEEKISAREEMEKERKERRQKSLEIVKSKEFQDSLHYSAVPDKWKNLEEDIKLVQKYGKTIRC